MRVFENRVLRRICGPNKDEVTGQWRKLHNEELNDLYSSSNIVRVIILRRMKWAGLRVGMGERRGEYRVLLGKPEGKRQPGRPRSRWEDDINRLNPELNPICYLLALLAHHFLHVSRIRVKSLTLRLLMSYIYIYIYTERLFLMFLDHTQRHTTVGRTPLDE